MPTFLASGGSVYGPFEGEVTLGSDARCKVLVGSSAPVHARLVPRPGGWVLHPMGAPLTLTRRTARNAPVSGPVQISQGDSFTLGNGGASFVVGATSDVASAHAAPPVAAPPPRAGGRTAAPSVPRTVPSGPRSGPQRGLPTAGALADEAARQAEVHAMRFGPVQQVRQALFRYQSGSLFQPRYIIGALFALFGGGFVTCSAMGAWIWAYFT